MKWWPLTGLKNYFTEEKDYEFPGKISNIIKDKVFKKSLHIFTIDVGNSNFLNFTIRALKAPQYNIHRFGIFFTETPRHADILIILGPLNKKMMEPLLETINQMPKDFGTIIINEENSIENNIDKVEIPNVIAEINKNISPDELLALLLKVSEKCGRS
jgi:Ni,Fe-hydrogenase III small subunit